MQAHRWLLAALGILVAERSGVLNLGVEGIMLMAAIAGYMATVETGSFAVKRKNQRHDEEEQETLEHPRQSSRRSESGLG